MFGTALTTSLASTGDHGDWWIVAPFFWALWLVVIASVVFLVFRAKTRGSYGGDRAKAILAERFARGEISTEEFRERLDALR